MRIVIADDSYLIRDRLELVLGQFGKVKIVGAFGNGTETLEALRKLKPDLAIIDIKMPGLSGLGVLRQIRGENTHIKIIVLTFYSSDIYRQTAMQSGADYFFCKNEEFEKISVVVETMLGKAATYGKHANRGLNWNPLLNRIQHSYYHTRATK